MNRFDTIHFLLVSVAFEDRVYTEIQKKCVKDMIGYEQI